MNEDVQALLNELKGKFDVRALELASLINAISRVVPRNQGLVLHLFALCVRARISELGLDPVEVVRAVDEVARVQSTAEILMAHDRAEPTHVDGPTQSILAKFRI